MHHKSSVCCASCVPRSRPFPSRLSFAVPPPWLPSFRPTCQHFAPPTAWTPTPTLQDPNAPKKNLSAFMYFSNSNRDKVKAENPGERRVLGAIAASRQLLLATLALCSSDGPRCMLLLVL